MKWLIVLWLMLGIARAAQLESRPELEPHAAQVLALWRAAEQLQLETGGQMLPQNLCFAPQICAYRLVAETEPTRTGVRALVAWALETAARPPPTWFWLGLVKRQATLLPNSSAKARVRAWVLAGLFPSLSELNLSYSSTNFVARDDFGSEFAEYLLNRFGLPKLKNVLRLYYANLTLSDAFLESEAVSLEQLFADWHKAAQLEAERTTSQLQSTGLPAGTSILQTVFGALVWTGAQEFVVAQGAGLQRGQIGSSQLGLLVKLPYLPQRLRQAATGELIYVRSRALGAVSGEVFSFFGREIQLTQNANATDAAPDGACVVYIKAFSSLWRWCAGISTHILAAPRGWVLSQLATRAGKMALTVQRGSFSDIALVADGRLEFLTSDAASDQDPLWLDAQTLIYSSDRLGTPQLWKQRIGDSAAEQLSAALGGVFAPRLIDARHIGFYTFWQNTSTLAQLELGQGVAHALERSTPTIAPTVTVAPSPANLLPEFGLAFSSGPGLEVRGAIGAFSYRFAGGYDLFGLGLGADFQLRLAPIQGLVWNWTGRFARQEYRSLLRATWSGAGEVGGERVALVFSPSLSLENGALLGWLDFVLGSGNSDTWGYTTQNWQFAAQVNTDWRYTLSWNMTDALLGGFVGLRMGVGNAGFSGNATLRATYPLLWRFGDGVFALERLTLLLSGALSSRETALGLQVLFDGVLNYSTLFVFGLEFGYSSRGAWALGFVFR
ncbi:MAG: TolB family protein [Deinococcales bacterium]